MTGAELLALINANPIIKKAYHSLFGVSYFSKTKKIKEAEAFLETNKTVDFSTNNAKALELLYANALIPEGPALLPENALDVKHSFTYKVAYTAERDSLPYINQLCKALFNTSEKAIHTQDTDQYSDYLEIEALIYFKKTPFANPAMFDLLRTMLNPKEGVIALRIINESEIELTPAIQQLLQATIQPAHLARVLYYLKALGELNEATLHLLATTIQAWESLPVDCIDDESEHGDTMYSYFHRLNGLALVLQTLDTGGILTKDKFDFLLNPERQTLFENSTFFNLLNHFSTPQQGLPAIIWDNLLAHYQSSTAEDIDEKMYRLNSIMHKFSATIQPIIDVLLQPENDTFLMQANFSACMSKLKLRMEHLSNETPAALRLHILALVAILRNANTTDSDLDNYIIRIGKAENTQHIKNIEQIKGYLTRIGFLTAENTDEILGKLVDTDHNALFMMTINGMSIASEMEFIPGPVFISHGIWQKLLTCCTQTQQDSLTAFKQCFEDIHAIILGPIEFPKPTPVERLIKIVVDAKNEEVIDNAKLTSLSHSACYKKVDFQAITAFITLLQEKNFPEAAAWLHDKNNFQEMHTGVFGRSLAEKLAEVQPFECANLRELTEHFKKFIPAKEIGYKRSAATI